MTQERTVKDAASLKGNRARKRQRAYMRGKKARAAEAIGRVWLEPHYPVKDGDLVQSWLEGWSDMDDQIERGEGS